MKVYAVMVTPEGSFSHVSQEAYKTLIEAQKFITGRYGEPKELSAFKFRDEDYTLYEIIELELKNRHISELVIYDKPKELEEFYRPCIEPSQICPECQLGFMKYPDDTETYFDTMCQNKVTRPPAGWCYVEEL